MSLASPPSKLVVYRGFARSPCYVWSPFVNKLEARLRLAGMAYSLGVGSPKSAPRGKIPYVAFEARPTELMGDTTLIIKKFVDDGFLSDLNAALTPVQRAQDLALRALLEDKVYFYQVRRRKPPCK